MDFKCNNFEIEINEGKIRCRLCLNSFGEFVLLTSKLTRNLNLLDVFNQCTNLNAFGNDNLPQFICSQCVEDLIFSYNLIKKAEESEAVLKLIERKEPTSFTEQDEIYKQNYSESEIINNDKENSSSNGIDDDTEEKFVIEELETERCLDIKLLQDDDYDEQYSGTEKLEEIYELKFSEDVADESRTDALQVIDEDLEIKNESFKCDVCKKIFSNKSLLLAHNGRVHGENNFLQKFVCEYCGKCTSTAQKLEAHHLVHTKIKNFQCTECSKRFSTVYRLRDHMQTHTGERKYKCEKCGQRFYKRNSLVCHMRRHTGERPYACEICGKTFSQTSIMKTHVTLHTGKTVECPTCKKKFSRPSHLILHQRDHTGERPYKCHICTNSYKQKSHLDRHLDTHMGVKYKCKECSKEYSHKSTLNHHMLEHSNEKRYKCDECPAVFVNRILLRRHVKKDHAE